MFQHLILSYDYRFKKNIYYDCCFYKKKEGKNMFDLSINQDFRSFEHSNQQQRKNYLESCKLIILAQTLDM